MTDLKKKFAVLKIIGTITGVLLLVLAVFLAVTAMTFSFGGRSSAPDIFGYNIYLVRDNDFHQLKAGTAALAQRIPPDEIRPGEIIIYNRYENGGAQLGKVIAATLKEAVMSYDIETEHGERITVSQGQYIAKVTHHSEFLGGIIGFVMSPFGVMTTAILPCIAIAVFELVKFIFSKLPAPEVETVKIQEENPTFIPRKKREEIERKRRAESKAAAKPDEHKEAFGKTVPTLGSPSEKSTHLEQLMNSDKVTDKADFSPAARVRMEHDLAEKKNSADADAAAKSGSASKTQSKNSLIPDEKKHIPKNQAQPLNRIYQWFSVMTRIKATI